MLCPPAPAPPSATSPPAWPLLGDSTAMNRGLSEAGGGTQPSCPCPRSPPLRVEFAGVV